MQIVVTNAGHRYRSGGWLFRHLDYEFSPGRMVAVMGPSGSGKSTLLSALSGSLVLSEGLIVRQGVDRITRVSQSAYGVAGLTVRDHLTLPRLVMGHSRRQAELEVLPIAERFGIDDLLEAPFSELSGGEAQRMMLARAVACEPDLILADEPTASLDSQNARVVITVLRQLCTSGAIVVIATHDTRARQECHELLDLGESNEVEGPTL